MAVARIFVTFSQVGYHNWPDAPRERAYLAQLHRHIFKVRVETTVDHADREIEFHDLIDEARRRFIGMHMPGQPDRWMCNFGGQSCEMLATRLAGSLADIYDRPITVTVSEDDECGATVTVDVDRS